MSGAERAVFTYDQFCGLLRHVMADKYYEWDDFREGVIAAYFPLTTSELEKSSSDENSE